jgi:hypothetical protein
MVFVVSDIADQQNVYQKEKVKDKKILDVLLERRLLVVQK